MDDRATRTVPFHRMVFAAFVGLLSVEAVVSLVKFEGRHPLVGVLMLLFVMGALMAGVHYWQVWLDIRPGAMKALMARPAEVVDAYDIDTVDELVQMWQRMEQVCPPPRDVSHGPVQRQNVALRPHVAWPQRLLRYLGLD